MSELKFATYEFSTKADNSLNKITKKRNRFIEMLTAQKERITNVDAKWLRGKEKVPVKKLWDETEKGVYFCPMIGRKPVLLDGKSNAIVCESPKALSKTIDLLISKTKAGDFDAALDAALARVAADAQAPSRAPKAAPKTTKKK
ncbi:hypothetical protein [Dongia sp.]|uniref:hypothetical protein n=1 Tax=Dongia sp. TaxID=1977262 RepID=UPI0035B38225